MLNIHFFDIPIYKKSEKDFIKKRTNNINEELKQYKEKIERLNSISRLHGKPILDLDKYLKEYELDQLRIEGGWLYNQIRHWLYIYFDGNKMKGIIYEKTNRKFKKSISKLFEIQLLSKIRKHSQQELAIVLTKKIEEKFYSKYSKKTNYIYLDTLRNILSFLDIKNFLETISSGKQKDSN